MNQERRSRVRYPIELAARYQTLGRGEPITGVGRTLNFSSGGLLITGEELLSEGVRLKVTVEWPSLLNGTTPLQLVTVGKVVRSGSSSFAVAFEQYQFRTMSRRSVALAAAIGSSAGVSNDPASGVPPKQFEPHSGTVERADSCASPAIMSSASRSGFRAGEGQPARSTAGFNGGTRAVKG